VLHWLVFTAVQTGITPLTSTSQTLKGRSIRIEKSGPETTNNSLFTTFYYSAPNLEIIVTRRGK